MKKTILAVVVTTVSGGVMANDFVGADNFDVSGKFAVGGTYDAAREGGKEWRSSGTGFDIFTDYRANAVIGKFGGEFRIEDDFGMTDSKFTITDAWIGYDFSGIETTIGYANDTALDAVDGFGDQTIEFMASPSDASDALGVAKVEGNLSGARFGISYYTDRNYKFSNNHDEAQSGYNMYVGYQNEIFGAFAGWEDNDNNFVGGIDDLYLVNAAVKLGMATVGATYTVSNIVDGDEVKMANASLGLQLADNWKVAGGYSHLSDAESYINLGTELAFTDSLVTKFDTAYQLEDTNIYQKGDMQVFARLDYSF